SSRTQVRPQSTPWRLVSSGTRQQRLRRFRPGGRCHADRLGPPRVLGHLSVRTEPEQIEYERVPACEALLSRRSLTPFGISASLWQGDGEGGVVVYPDVGARAPSVRSEPLGPREN